MKTEAEYARHNCAKAIANAAEAFERVAMQMRAYHIQFEESTDDRDRTNVISWAIGAASYGVGSNARIDLMANEMARLAAASAIDKLEAMAAADAANRLNVR